MIPDRRTVTRRRFLEHLIASGALAAGGFTLAGCRTPDDGAGGAPSTLGSGFSDGDGPEPTGRLTAGAVAGRVLVVVDLQGGNDGLSTLVPYASGRYHDLRPNLAVPDDDVLLVDDEVGFHPSLARLARRGITTVEGVGPIDGDLSHFDMSARWARGDVSGTDQASRSGFLGRLTDALDDGSPLVGVSLGPPTTHLTNRRASTMSLPSPEALWFLQPDQWAEATAYQQQLAAMAGDGDGAPGALGIVGEAYGQLLDLAAELPAGDGIDWEESMISEGGDLGRQLYLAADVIAADVGTRVVYAAAADYDTHSNHRYTQTDNLAQLDAAVDGFLTRAAEGGFADRVVVATISEFGRRVPENDSGLDHGSASTMLVAGPVGDVRAGERPPLDDLDDDDNLRTIIGFDRYLASLAEEWLGVEAASVLAGEPEPLNLF